MQKQFKDYGADGYATFRSFFPQEEIDEMNVVFDELSAAALLPSEGYTTESFQENRSGLVNQLQHPHRRDTLFARLVGTLRPLAISLLNAGCCGL